MGAPESSLRNSEAADFSEGNSNPDKVPQTTYRVLRDTKLARQIRLLYRDECQVCRSALSIGPGQTYSEAHHVVPLGSPHSGPDTASNILVLCPNHHPLLDYGAAPLDEADLHFEPGHALAAASIEYHNLKIYAPKWDPA